ncbi:F-box/LRR-repeat protein 4-like [Metopolophium dirhodum]|uniref:F-box/LRR-repeat protein 4-like n=1 Tax=Metopolophium dirhodum TaxID=44670 RepID=UPI0029902029|nr:F-box/LRR-repeat protein 4-like [Metopolophium dirhodum]
MSVSGQLQTTTQNMDDTEKSCPKCVFDRLPPEMIRFIFRKQSTDDLLQASATTDRLYRVAQHHMYASEGALLVRGGQDTAATVTRTFDVRNVTSLYLVDVYDFDRDVPRQLRRCDDDSEDVGEDGGKDGSEDGGEDSGEHTSDEDDDDDDNDNELSDKFRDGRRSSALDVLHVGYGRDVSYTNLPVDGLRRLLSGVRARRVCFSNVVMTADDVADAVSAMLEARDDADAVIVNDNSDVVVNDNNDVVVNENNDNDDDYGDDDDDGSDSGDGGEDIDSRPPVLRCSHDRADDNRVMELMDAVERTCAGLLSEFRVTIRRPAPHAYAVYPMSRCGSVASVNDWDDTATAANAASTVAAETPEDLLALTAADCSGLGPAAYRRLAPACRRLRRLTMKAARQVDDDGFVAVAGMPSLQHLDMEGMSEVTSDGLLSGLVSATGLQSLGLADCPYVTDDVLRRVGEMRQLRNLRLDLTDCDKTTAAGVTDMLSGCERLRELDLTLPLNADYVAAAAFASHLDHLRTFRLTFERLSFQDHLDDQPTNADWQQSLAAGFRDDVEFSVRQTFTKITVTVD